MDPDVVGVGFQCEKPVTDFTLTIVGLLRANTVAGARGDLAAARDAGLARATLLIAIVPVVILFIFIERYLIGGLTAGSVK